MGEAESPLQRVAAAINASGTDEDDREVPSLVSLASDSYGVGRPGIEPADPDRFDGAAAALFEAVVESAYLVAHADGVFDEAEQRAFREVVVATCGGNVHERQIGALLADLDQLLAEDGLDKRLLAVSRSVVGPGQAWELMRVAALLAAVSGGVSAEERSVLSRLAAGLALGEPDVERAIAEARRAIGVTAPAELD